MLDRKLKKIIETRLKQFPAVALVGPRQVGKTTLAKQLPGRYFDLELEEEKVRLDIHWNEIVSADGLTILDEAQNYPEIFHRIRSAIDLKREQPGRFLILGSVSPGLMKQVSEFLTGRIALCELSPFSIQEVSGISADNLWLMGGFPDGGILKSEQFLVWQNNYLNLLAMRDLPAWGLPSTPQMTLRFMKMLAINNGLLWNASQIGKSLGITYHTVNSYLDYLDQVFLIRRMHPYFPNIKKRLTKSPKVYFRDSGLLHNLLGVTSFDDLLGKPWVGFSWEGWIISQILIWLQNEAILFDGPYFLRTRDGQEIDLIIIINGKLWTFEIKLTSAPRQEDVTRFRTATELIHADFNVLISRTPDPIRNENFFSMNITDFLDVWDP
jgi:hypothetical protein